MRRVDSAQDAFGAAAAGLFLGPFLALGWLVIGFMIATFIGMFLMVPAGGTYVPATSPVIAATGLAVGIYLVPVVAAVIAWRNLDEDNELGINPLSFLLMFSGGCWGWLINAPAFVDLPFYGQFVEIYRWPGELLGMSTGWFPMGITWAVLAGVAHAVGCFVFLPFWKFRAAQKDRREQQSRLPGQLAAIEKAWSKAAIMDVGSLMDAGVDVEALEQIVRHHYDPVFLVYDESQRGGDPDTIEQLLADGIIQAVSRIDRYVTELWLPEYEELPSGAKAQGNPLVVVGAPDVANATKLGLRAVAPDSEGVLVVNGKQLQPKRRARAKRVSASDDGRPWAILDAGNISKLGSGDTDPPNPARILEAKMACESDGFRVQAYMDASLMHFLTPEGRKAMKTFELEGWLEIVPRGIEADALVARHFEMACAEGLRAVIVAGDFYRDLHHKYPALADRSNFLVPMLVMGKLVMEPGNQKEVQAAAKAAMDAKRAGRRMREAAG